jgi:prevent-host-death family protein
MAITTLSSREFNQDIGRAKKAATKGPVIITDRGRPAHVLLTIGDYQKLSGAQADRANIVDLLAMPVGAEIGFEPPRLAGPRARVPDLS